MISGVSLHSPPNLEGAVIQLPGSKSIANRLLIMQHLAGKEGLLSNLPAAYDTVLLQAALETTHGKYFLGNAGTAMRFMAARACLLPGTHQLQGDDRMHHRPISYLVVALRQLGADVRYAGTSGFPPLEIYGNPQLAGGKLTIDATQSSQFASALAMIGPYLKGGLELTLRGSAVSLPYLDMTLSLMRNWGVDAVRVGNIVSIPEGTYSPQSYLIDADWSAAIFWYGLAALGKPSSLLLKGLQRNGLQGDEMTATLFEEFNVISTQTAEGIHLEWQEEYMPTAFTAHLQAYPDLTPALICTCAALEITCHLTGLQHLAIKESHRIDALVAELRRLGAGVSSTHDSITLHQPVRSVPHPIRVRTYNDHRMAMAFSILAAKFPNIIIEEPGVTRKSYPLFWEHLAGAGAVFHRY